MKLFKRENYLSKIRGFYHTNDIIKVITGIRRCGKSSLMQMIADEIIESGVNKENIIYINLDKKGFKNIKKADELENLIDSLSNVKGNKYLFIDEIQNVENFEEVVNAYREEDEYSIFITGSNLYLLSGELITKLTGRYIEFEMFPLTFEEYLGMKEFYKYDINSNLLIELNNYIIEGGFPRTMFFDDLNDKRTYVKGIVEEIFKKDIKSRCVIRKKETFDLVMNYIINNFGCTTSINNILENLNKSGLGISKTTLLRYIKCLIDAKILYECDRFDMKSKRSLLGEKKYYITGDTLYNEEIFEDIPDDIYALFLPVNGVGNNMNMTDAARFAKRVNAKKTVPLHIGLFDNLNPDDFECDNKVKAEIYKEIKL